LEINPSDAVLFEAGSLKINFTDPENTNLLARYHTFLLTLDPIDAIDEFPREPLYELQLSRTNFAQARLIDEVKKGDPLAINLLGWLSEQAQHLASHARNATNSIAANNINGARSHSEHTINMIRDLLQHSIDAEMDNDGSAASFKDEVSAFIDIVIDARETARQIAFADSLELIVRLGYDQEIEAVISLGDQISEFSQRAEALDLTLYILLTPAQSQ
jgi:hypothetical protein